MKELMNKRIKAIEEKARLHRIMGTENARVTLVLTNEEIKEFEEMNLDERYIWELEGNKLYVSYVEEIAINKVYVEDLGKEFDLKELEKAQETYEHEGKKLWLIQDSYPNDYEDEYTALAIDNKGNMYCITWDIIDFKIENKSAYTVKAISRA